MSFKLWFCEIIQNRIFKYMRYINKCQDYIDRCEDWIKKDEKLLEKELSNLSDKEYIRFCKKHYDIKNKKSKK